MRIRHIHSKECYTLDQSSAAWLRSRYVSDDGKTTIWLDGDDLERNFVVVEEPKEEKPEEKKPEEETPLKRKEPEEEGESEEFSVKAIEKKKAILVMNQTNTELGFKPKWDRGSTNDPLLHGKIIGAGTEIAKQNIIWNDDKQQYELDGGSALNEEELIKLMIGLREGEVKTLINHQGMGFPLEMDLYDNNGMWVGEIVSFAGGIWPYYRVKNHVQVIRQIPVKDVMMAFYNPNHEKAKYYIKDNRPEMEGEEPENEMFEFTDPNEIIDGGFWITDSDEEYVSVTNGKIFLCCQRETFATFGKSKLLIEEQEQEIKEPIWEDWPGEEQAGPTGDSEQHVDIEFRDGEIIKNVPAGVFKWKWDDRVEQASKDIVKFRIL